MPEIVVENITQPVNNRQFLALLPLKNVVILPKSIIPIIVGRKSSIQAVEYALKHDKALFITAQKDQSVEDPTFEDVFTVGTRATILQVMRMPSGALKILAEGICRSQVSFHEATTDEFIGVYCDDIKTEGLEDTIEVQAIWRQLKGLYTSYAKLSDEAPEDLLGMVKAPYDVDFVSDTIAVHANLSFDERQSILEMVDIKKRMLKLCTLLKKEIEILQTEQRIRGRIKKQVEKSQKEYYLNEQMKAIQKELGRGDQSAEIAQMKDNVKKLGLSVIAQEKVNKELHRLEQMPPLSSEAVVSRHYVDWMTSIPWKKRSKDTISLAQGERILNKHHAGLKKPKERIIEFLAAKKFARSDTGKSPIICFVGPPGVGKTSLAGSIAKSLSREFVRISLGGVKDEAEIRGHRRTYIGALPGKIIQAMKRANTINPVILLDEIDKMGRDLHGDPASALLEVLDPEQNKTFVDHFLDVEYDLSQVMFIATANMIDGIPYPLYDRMEIITLSGYVDEEKIEIAKKFLIPKGLKEHGLTARQFKIPTALLQLVITDYTKEAGVRQIERVLATLMRKSIQVLLKDSSVKAITITKQRIKKWLGFPKFKKTSLSQVKNKVGIATGLAWTELGGDVLEVETSAINGKGNLTLTGQLGEVMQESAQAALSYIRSRATDLGLKNSFYTNKDLHIHLPEGATPKDGPSAGITICVALISALTNKPVIHDLAMTGEITLQGRILSVGGLKEKLLAAIQHGMKTVIVPAENEDDIAEVATEIDLSPLKIIYTKSMDDVLKAAFEKNVFKKIRRVATKRKK